MYSNSKNIFIPLITGLIAIIIYFIGICAIEKINFGMNRLEEISLYLNWIGIFILLYVILTNYIINRDIITPYNIFWIFFFLFNYGQQFMWAFGIHSDKELGIGYTAGIGTVMLHNIVKGQLFTCICMFLFHTGAMFSYKWKGKNNIENYEIKNKSIFITGIILGILSIIPTLYRSFNFFIVSRQYGYNALYYSDNISQGGILMILEIFFFPSLICIILGGKKNAKKFAICIFAIYLILNLLSGDRGSWIYKLLALIWFMNRYYSKINFKKFIKYILIFYIFMYILDFIIYFRDLGISNIDIDKIKIFLLNYESPIIKTIFELGGSIGIISTMFTMPNVLEVWNFGNSYLTSILGVVSTRFLSVLGIPFILLDNWFSQDFLGISWGAGFSMIGEAYLNGGIYIGPIIILLIGWIIGSILYDNKEYNPKFNKLRYIMITLTLAIIPGLSRGSTYLFLKNWFYGCLVVLFLIVLIDKILIKDKM
ncbi:O-antigen polysaccharide polymerase Wzy [uncultured Clostridium sp.]|uniref:O-antigen polysaccharide polymerase Wzy n=1 Tax=uncultured Clostridium sp. TaxID=59620 RepID=UPI002585FB69|nr:O-antigen polysaccharide polymerase Wzy [uncultured Clostridium sp.]